MRTFSSGAKDAVAVLTVLFSGLVAPGPARAAAETSEPPTEPAHMELLTQSGAGCAPGTVSASMLPDNTAFQVDYTDNRAVTGGGAGAVEFLKQCSVGLLLHPPEGFSYALVRRDNWGRAHVEPGLRASYALDHYYTPSSVPSHKTTESLLGPFDGEWHTAYLVEPARQIFVPCGQERVLHLITHLYLARGDAAAAPSWISMQTSDAQVHALYQLEWKRC
jgi:hypothetical protein